MDVSHWQDSEKDWKFYFDEGKSYLGTTKKLLVKKGPYNNEFIYHLAILGGERLALGLLLSYNHVPASTSLAGMLRECKQYVDLDDSLFEGARYLNKFQNFCALDTKALNVPKDDELEKIVDYIQTLYDFSEGNLNNKASNE